MSEPGPRRVSRAGGQGAACGGLRAVAVAAAVAGLLAAGCTAGPQGRGTAGAPATAASAGAARSPAARAGVPDHCAPGTACYTPAQPPSASLRNTADAVAAAVAGLRLGPALGSVMSVSAAGQIGGEHCVSRAQAGRVTAALRAALDRGMTVVAASGDMGAAAYQCDVYSALTGTAPAGPVKGVSLLASDPLVLGAGGTSLTAGHATGAWIGETAWGLASGNPGNQGGSFQASGGGFSQLFARPAYQAGVPGIGATRGVPDVSADASDRTGVAVVFSNGTGDTIQSHGGTSASAPIWAALIALANQYAGRRLGFINPAIYRIARSPRYHQAFHDVITGNNTVQFPPTTITGYPAAPGWDPVTGWGSPNAQVLIPLLARHAGP